MAELAFIFVIAVSTKYKGEIVWTFKIWAYKLLGSLKLNNNDSDGAGEQWQISGTYYMPSIVLSTLHKSVHLIFITNFWGKYFYSLSSTNEKKWSLQS